MSALDHLTLLWPWCFLALPLPWLARRWLPAFDPSAAALTVPALARFRGNDTADAAPGRLPRHSLILLWCAWLALVTAAARPEWVGEPVSLPVTGRDVMLAVDLSGSMGTEDMALNGDTVNRLVMVKDVLGQFIERRTGDRLGLVLFGTNAYVQAPLTFDVATVRRLLDEAPIGIAGGRTAIGDAIGLGVKLMRERPADQRVLILLTDGASNAGEIDPRTAADLAAANEVRIYTIGVGADTMRLPGLFGALTGMVNPSADMDEDTLTAVAERTGGRYFRARSTETLTEIYALIDALEPIAQDPEIYRPRATLYHWPLALAWVLIVALGLSASRRAGRHV